MKNQYLIASFVSITITICLIGSTNANIPANLNPADTESQVLHLPAIGVQIYACRVVDGKPAAWTFVAPEADLFESPSMKLVGKHDAGPHWALFDGSKVVGKVSARADATNQGAIPSLLLTAKSVGSKGKLDAVTSIQRLNTVGGIAPTTGCTAANIGKEARIYYTADYYFFAPKQGY